MSAGICRLQEIGVLTSTRSWEPMQPRPHAGGFGGMVCCELHRPQNQQHQQGVSGSTCDFACLFFVSGASRGGWREDNTDSGCILRTLCEIRESIHGVAVTSFPTQSHPLFVNGIRYQAPMETGRELLVFVPGSRLTVDRSPMSRKFPRKKVP